MKYLIAGLVLLAIAVSLRKRMKMSMWRSAQSYSSGGAASLARAITSLVGTAGGIYLSLELLLTFLGVPEQIWNPPSLLYFKPLAAFSLMIAILQPYGQQMVLNIRKRRG